mmetsp:Transcript_39228/g.76724  ORF Transcript_39228/g.76724 Transcript_39228/m.76724 type:complete len:234 (+) Transcript_39228:127-828(+)|eukprot:CAMPEP_0173392606 /NCGR_PEP_ID=MMETSP1356-20130122/20290_1 /TAXON_ID=77927 ORGANISM="Hemiselmis virescens, Strain PCC157" /NCGR_SAMPLE_ID=MMETSP1356 /ASSEMBLY_ACC=CAM_ASM_000847 /LENGTH=233 /DNA_ID=CAMNT_0014350445 /DNA_START=107 /DNA_END=808 /DNA_ORIENTATION=+
MLRLAVAGLVMVSSASAFLPTPLLSALPTSSSARLSLAPRMGVSMQAVAGVAEAKSELLSMLKETGLGKGEETEEQAKRIDQLVESLSKAQTKFDRTVADGEWALVLSRNSKGSPKLQQASNKMEKVGTSFANFDSSEGKFYNIAEVFGGKGKLKATVAFSESDTESGSRISCDIVDASIKLWKLPTLPLPLRAKGGWLDFLYLDEDMRVTRGNRGGLFFHVRPSKLSEVSGK